jgi:short-subunit dehydrogenase
VLGFIALQWRGAYVATKYAVEGWADTLRLEMSGAPIHISLIEPGPVTSRIRQNSVAHFERWIDWRASARAEQYEAGLLRRLYAEPKQDRFELPPAAVTRKLIHALEARRPKPRYYVTTPNYVAGTLRRLLPTRALDRILVRQ